MDQFEVVPETIIAVADRVSLDYLGVPYSSLLSVYDAFYCIRIAQLVVNGEILLRLKQKLSSTVLHWKGHYNEKRGLPEPIQGDKSPDCMCPYCGSINMYFSAHPDDPDEMFSDHTRCSHCGRISSLDEAAHCFIASGLPEAMR